MFCREFLAPRRRLPGMGMLILAALLLSACGIDLGGARGTAVKQVRTYVEATEVSPELQQLYKDLPTKVVFEYARAMFRQGTKLGYQTASAEAPDARQTRVIVGISHKSVQPGADREYRLLVELEKESKGAWRVTSMRALP